MVVKMNFIKYEPKYGDTLFVDDKDDYLNRLKDYQLIKHIDKWTDGYIKQIIKYIKIYKNKTKAYRKHHKFKFQKVRHIKGKEYVYIGGNI